MENKEAKVFPKLFIGSAAIAFKQYLKKNNCHYQINYISSSDELASFISLYSSYKSYTLPVIISDISFFSKKDQSMLLKFMDDTNLKLVLLASRDNILDTIISRVREFRKYYIIKNSDKVGFINTDKARDMLYNDLLSIDESNSSVEDKIMLRSKYNPMLSYDDSLVKKFCTSDKKRLLSLLEYM